MPLRYWPGCAITLWETCYHAIIGHHYFHTLIAIDADTQLLFTHMSLRHCHCCITPCHTADFAVIAILPLMITADTPPPSHTAIADTPLRHYAISSMPIYYDATGWPFTWLPYACQPQATAGHISRFRRCIIGLRFSHIIEYWLATQRNIDTHIDTPFSIIDHWWAGCRHNRLLASYHNSWLLSGQHCHLIILHTADSAIVLIGWLPLVRYAIAAAAQIRHMVQLASQMISLKLSSPLLVIALRW